MRLQLERPAALGVRRGHPWVYREGIAPRRSGQPGPSGTSVEVTDEKGEILGRGLWDAESPIAIRMFEPGAGPKIDARSITKRIEAALARRDGRFDQKTTAYRLVNGEGDRVPGLVIDRYGEVAVVRLDTTALEPHLGAIVEALAKPLGARGVRSIAKRLAGDRGGKKIEGLRGPPPPDRIDIVERGMTMEVDLAHGQKTGAFLDQRESRAKVRELSRGRARVLNLFSYAGGFSIAAALGGAGKVTSVDIASGAHATAQKTFRKNDVDPGAHGFVTADAFAFLEKAEGRGERFELVVCDPPSFAPSEKAKPKALAAYRKLHGAAARLVAEGGVFCASSCSSHVTAEDFAGTLDDAALGRSDLSLVELFGQPEDHPTLPAWPEGRYLKFAVLR